MSNFHNILKELRINRNIKQTDIAKHLNVLPRTIRFYESGEREPDFDKLIALADYLDCSVDYLLGRTNNPK